VRPIVQDLTTEGTRARRSLRTWASGWVAAFGWAALIFVASATPDPRFLPDESLDFIVRKIGHMGVFGILALLIWRALVMTTAWRRPWAWAIVLAVVYAASDELHQAVVVRRHASVVDVGIDAAGALIAVSLAWLVRSRRSRARGPHDA
jgi:VanZ family protein